MNEIKKIHYGIEGDQGHIENARSPENMPTIQIIDEHFRKDLDPELSDAQKGLEMLKKAGAYDGEKPGIIDQAIQQISLDIKNERAKEKPNWAIIGQMVRQLASLLLRKAGKADQELTQTEIDRMCEDILKVTGTYKNIWSLMASIGGGLCGIIGGLVGMGGSVYGLGELINGATKVSNIVGQTKGFADATSTLTQGIQLFSKPLESSIEAERQFAQHQLGLTTNRRDAAQGSASQNRNMLSGSLSNYERQLESIHSAIMRVISGSAS